MKTLEKATSRTCSVSEIIKNKHFLSRAVLADIHFLNDVRNTWVINQTDAVKESRIDDVFQNYNSLEVSYENILQEIENVLKKKQFGMFQNKDNQYLEQVDMNFVVDNISDILSKLESFKPKDALAGINNLLKYDIDESIREKLNYVANLLSLYEDDKAEDELHKLVDMYGVEKEID